MSTPPKKVHCTLVPPDKFVDGKKALGPKVGLNSLSATNSFCARNEWVGQEDNGRYWSTQNSLSAAAPGVVQHRNKAQKTRATEAIKHRTRNADGRVLQETIHGTIVTDSDEG